MQLAVRKEGVAAKQQESMRIPSGSAKPICQACCSFSGLLDGRCPDACCSLGPGPEPPRCQYLKPGTGNKGQQPWSGAGGWASSHPAGDSRAQGAATR